MFDLEIDIFILSHFGATDAEFDSLLDLVEV
jgi:hypothetical protein